MGKQAQVEEPMLKKLRRKLIFTNVAFAALVLLSVGAAILLSDYHQHERAIYVALERSLMMEEPRQEGGIPGDWQGGSMTGDKLSSLSEGIPQEGMSPAQDSADDAEEDTVFDVPISGEGVASEADSADGQGYASDETDAMEMPKRDEGDNRGMFSFGGAVRADDGQFVATSVYEISSTYVATVRRDSLSLDDETEKSALSIAMAKVSSAEAGSVSKGRIASLGLYYHAKVLEDGTVKVALAPAGYVTQTLVPLVRTLLLLGLAAMACFVAISMVLARWAIRPVAHAWEQQQQFVADASHELKTPLAVILANNSIIMSDPQATVGSQMKWVESTESEAHLMQGLVNDMLYLAQAESTQKDVEYDPVDFSDIVQGSVLQFESVAFERNVTIEDNIVDDVMVKGDPARMHRLVGTLVDNACKYADEGSSVRVDLEREGQKCRLTVRNAGSVIPAEDLPHLFDRFYRSDKARTREEGGFGLGLSIAKGVVDGLGGVIRATSTEQDGTCFIVELPTA